jgi:exopolysaccharide biosynthesis polyprenyl glycosylphosphotransferase
VPRAARERSCGIAVASARDVIREHIRLLRQVFRLADGVAVTTSFVVAYYVRKAVPVNLLSEPRAVVDYLQLLLIVVPIWVVLLECVGGYTSFRTSRVRDVLAVVLKVEITGFLVLSGVLFLVHLTYVSRAFLLAFAVLSSCLLVAERVGLLLFFRAIRRRGYNYRNVLVVGTSPRARDFAEMLDRHRQWGFRVVGHVDEDPRLCGQLMNGHRVLGRLEDIPRIADDRFIDEVVFVVPRSWLSRLDASMRLLDELGIKATFALDFFDLPVSRPRLGDAQGVPTLTYSPTARPDAQMVIKRLADLALATLMLVLASPAFLVIAVAIRLSSPGPVLFRQERVGLHGRRFTMLKFRSMVVDAEQRRAALERFNEVSGPVFKIARDPRVTPVGRWLRTLSLDELPQLLNVIRGEMSLVGPRPPLPHEVEQYRRWQRRRLSVKPGVTGLWQVSGRTHVDFDAWMRLDLAYIDNWSLGLDLKILAKTIPAVMSGTGAS